jgi:hypothetical protein
MASIDNVWVVMTSLMCLVAAVHGLPPNSADTPLGGDILLEGESVQVMACVFQCPNGKKPEPNPDHVPSYNGCGTYGANIDFLMCPYLISCCNYHDLCYDKFGRTREECDDDFYYCTQTRPSRLVSVEAHDICTAMGKTMYAAVRAFGCPAYKSAQKNACICVSALHSHSQ